MAGGAGNLKIRELTVVFGEGGAGRGGGRDAASGPRGAGARDAVRLRPLAGGDADDRPRDPRGRRVAPPRLPVERGARAGVFPLPRAGFDVAVARGGALRRRAPDADPGAGAGGGAAAAADGRAGARALPGGPGPAAPRDRNDAEGAWDDPPPRARPGRGGTGP